ADLNGDGKDDFIFANEALDHVDVHYSQPGQSFTQDRANGLLAPGAVKLADLNRDGIPDLLVANSGANNVLVYLGLGNGQFGPVHSFFAGTNPAGITVKDLNGDRLPDLVVANEGSNDATVLLGQGTGAAWTLTSGPRLRAGAGPVQSAVEDVTGDGIPDILIANSQSNNVSLLRGLGGGFFNDQSPIVFPTGIDPRQVFAGNFDGQPGIDLVTVNAGSNDLSFFSNLGAGRNMAAGGERPVAAVSGDFNHDGLSDLLVANNSDGQVALLLGSVDGPSLARLFPTGDLRHPTDLALNADGSAFYVVNEGEEAVARFTLDLGIVLPIEPGRPGTDFLPLTESALATVAIPLTSAAEPAAALTETGEPTLAIGTLLASAASEIRGDEVQNAVAWPLDEENAANMHMAPNPAEDLPGFVIGLEEAFERNGR